MPWMPGEELSIKILSTLEKLVGAIFSPWQIRRTGKAENDVLADQKIKLGIAEKYIEQMDTVPPPKELKGNVLEVYQSQVLPTIEKSKKEILNKDSEAQVLEANKEMPEYLMNLTKHTATRMIRRELQREINIRKIAIIAQEEAQSQKEEPVSEEPVNPDWIIQWLNLSQDISDKDIQIALGKILAGETRKPGSFSLKTLDFLRTVSKGTLEKFQKLCSFHFEALLYNFSKSKFIKEGHYIWKLDENIPAEYEIPAKDTIELEEEGLISTNGFQGFTYMWRSIQIPVEGATHSVTSLKRGIKYGQEIISLEPKQVMYGTNINFAVFHLSKIGKDLLKFLEFKKKPGIKELIINNFSNSCNVEILQAKN